MPTPVITNVDNVNKTYTSDGQNYALNPATQRFQLASTIPVPASSIQPGSKVVIPPTPIDNTMGAVNASNNELVMAQTGNATAESGYSQANKDLQSLTDQLMGKIADTQSAEQAVGIPGINQNINELQDISRQKTIEYNTNPYSLAGQGRGITTGVLRGQEAVKQRQLGIDIMLNNSNLQAAQGKLQLAQATVDRAIAAKYDPILARIESQKTILENNKYLLSRSDKNLADAKVEQLRQQERLIEEKKAEEKDTHNTALKIGQNMASLGLPQTQITKVMDAINNAKTFNEKIIAMSPYLQSAQDRADLSYKVAQTSKIYADMRNDAQTLGSNVAPENMLPFSQEYAATGKIPVGAPKGSAAAIMRYAKELPQAPGSIVSSITGVKNTSLGVEAQGDIARLYNITEAVKELKKLDEKRIGGLVGGTLGKVFGSDAQSAYLTKRKSIIDDISRMQSGAALTAEEVAFYEDYLPGRFSETAGLGQDSLKKIEKFEQAMNEKLKNALNNNQLSIYGYSTIEAPNGQEYKVGDLIQSNGVTGRVNPDGTVTVVQ